MHEQDNLQKEVDHLARVLKQNGYPVNFICNASAPPTQETADVSSPEEEQEKGPLVVIPYVAGTSGAPMKLNVHTATMYAVV